MLGLLLLVAVVGVGVGAVVRFRYLRRNMYKLAAQIASPKGKLPIIGVAHKLVGNTTEIMESLMQISYETMENDGILQSWFGPLLYFYVSDPGDVEVVLKTCLEKDDILRFLRKVIGNGSIFAPVSIWRRRRKVLVPAFSPKIIEKFVEVFSEQANTLATNLAHHADGNKFSVWPLLNTFSMAAVFETVMGTKINAQANSNSIFLKSVNRLLNVITERICHPWLHPDWLFKCIKHKYNEHQKCVNILHRFTDQIIEQKRRELKTDRVGKTEADREFDLKAYKHKTFLELLISLSGGAKGYTNVELREEVLMLTVAGTDTSAVTVGCTLKLLGKYPEVQNKVYQELTEVFGNSDRLLVKEDLQKLKYLDRVVKESLRLFPPAPFIVRKVLEDIKLPSGRVLPAGSNVVVSIWGAHRDPKYWGSEAEHFDPDRFSPRRFNLAHACSYMPFSNGPRSCPAFQYAHMAIKTALSAVLRRYKVVGDVESGPIPNIKVKIDIMMKAVDDYEITLERR